jgi:hypothetical protein
MYDAIKFFGSCKELLSFTRSLRVAELLEQEHSKNVHSNHTLPQYATSSVVPLDCGDKSCPCSNVHSNKPKVESFSNFGDLLTSVGCPFASKRED